MLGTFYYPWYGDGKNLWRHWKEDYHNPPQTWASNFAPDLDSSAYDPSNQLYGSLEDRVIQRQISLMKQAGLDFAVSSWWGSGDYTDQAFKNALAISKKENPGLRWCLYYEKEGYANLQESVMGSDLEYISGTYSKDSAYLKIDGKPVVFVYSNADDSLDYIQRWGRAHQNFGNVFVVLKVVKGFRQYANLVDSWHQYAPANRIAKFEPYSAFVSPGYWKYHERPKLERNLGQFREAVRQLKDMNVQFQLVETWNEFHEGTMIEPARQIVHNDGNPPFREAGGGSYGTEFIDAMRD